MKAPATVSRGEVRKERDGTSGGAYYVCINGLALGTGYDFQAKELADEIARRWNHVASGRDREAHLSDLRTIFGYVNDWRAGALSANEAMVSISTACESMSRNDL